MDGDGSGDLVVGAYKTDGSSSEEGAAYVFYGPITGALTPADADAFFPRRGRRRPSWPSWSGGASTAIMAATHPGPGIFCHTGVSLFRAFFVINMPKMVPRS